MGRAHSRRLNVFAFVVLLVALGAGTGLSIHAQRANPNVQHDEAWSYASAAGRLGPLRGCDGRRPHRPLGAGGRLAALLAVERARRGEQDRPRPRHLRRASAALLRPAARLAGRAGDKLVGGAGAQPGVRGTHCPLHLRVGAGARVREDRGRARGTRLGGESGGGQHLVARAPVRFGRLDDGPARLGAGAGLGATSRPARRRTSLAHVAVARHPLGGGRDCHGAAHALSGRTAGRRRRTLWSRRRPRTRSGHPAAAVVAIIARTRGRHALRSPSRARVVGSIRARTLAARRRLSERVPPEAGRHHPDARPVRRRPGPRRRRRRRRDHRPVPRPTDPPHSRPACADCPAGLVDDFFFVLVTAGGICLQNLLFLSMPPRISARYLAMAWPFFAFLPLLFFGIWPRPRYALTAAFCLLVLSPRARRDAAAPRRRRPAAARAARRRRRSASSTTSASASSLASSGPCRPAPQSSSAPREHSSRTGGVARRRARRQGVLREHPAHRRRAPAAQPHPGRAAEHARRHPGGHERDGEIYAITPKVTKLADVPE